MSTEPLPLTLVFKQAGSASELARRLKITPSAVLQWDKVPPTRVLEVERITGVSRHLLRPDIFGARPFEGVTA
ncbi:helix-turn-helix domain-containing protein [Ensifer sp. ENS02]|uniref:transcriptional regulator n=1 Tax=Ensifer sp. ENS02 TaxID=2769290 RepID=UPI00177D80DC|nr:Cro/CI family transcriptional regulator [Ensifer sp. ENS02]MBD9519318.1 helix-turn-helix domain-containing protein [Ensifer sp. ENS02]